MENVTAKEGSQNLFFFLKTMDGLIVMKALQPVETQASLKFTPAYFRFMSEAFFHEVNLNGPPLLQDSSNCVNIVAYSNCQDVEFLSKILRLVQISSGISSPRRTYAMTAG